MNLDELRPILEDLSDEFYAALVVVLSLMAIRLLVYRVIYGGPVSPTRGCLMSVFSLVWRLSDRPGCLLSPMTLFEVIFRWLVGLGWLLVIGLLIRDLAAR